MAFEYSVGQMAEVYVDKDHETFWITAWLLLNRCCFLVAGRLVLKRPAAC